MAGRNDPCPCNSGKKYKKCCLAKDRAVQAQAREEQEAVSELEITQMMPSVANDEPIPISEPEVMKMAASEPGVDPLIERTNIFWKRFSDASYKQKWELAADMLANEPELCDGELIFEIANMLFAPAIEAGEMTRFNRLLDQFEETVPDRYAKELSYLLEWRISTALVAGDNDLAEKYFYQFSLLAGDDLDTYFRIMSTLSYHGKLHILREGMRQARPFVANGANLISWADDEFVSQLGTIELLYQLDNNPDLKPDDPTLLQHFTEYGVAITPNRFATILGYQSGHTAPAWTVADFQLSKSQKEESIIERLSYALASFAYFACQEGVPPTKAEMGRDELAHYFTQRRNGALNDSDVSPNRGQKRKKRRKNKGKRSEQQPQHPLCPDAQTLDRYLSQRFGFLSSQRYEAFALFELIPLWLRFLVQYDLLDETSRQANLQELTYLKEHIIRIAENDMADPTIKENVLDWPAMRETSA